MRILENSLGVKLLVDQIFDFLRKLVAEIFVDFFGDCFPDRIFDNQRNRIQPQISEIRKISTLGLGFSAQILRGLALFHRRFSGFVGVKSFFGKFRGFSIF